MAALSASYPASKITHRYADTNLGAVRAECALSSMTQLKGEGANARGRPKLPQPLQHKAEWQKQESLGGRTFGPTMPPHVPLSSPGGSFSSDLLLFFADMLFLGAFAPISFSSLQVTNFMNIQPTLKCKISNHLFEWRIWLIAELSNQVNFPGYISVWTRPWYRHSFSSVRAKKRGKPRIHLRTCSILYNRWKNTSNIWTYILTVQENTTDLFAFPQISFYKLPFSNTFIPNL